MGGPRFCLILLLAALIPWSGLARVMPAVVNISVRGQSTGSGVVIDKARGLLVTNLHVIEDGGPIVATTTDGRRRVAVPVTVDRAADIAILRVAANGLVAAKLGDSSKLRVGDFVIAIGNPFGLGQTATSGIVGGLGRSGLGVLGRENFIQTDAPVNPGNSGGPLVNLKGRVVGINTAIIGPGGTNAGIAFAIPATMVRKVLAGLAASAPERARPRLGIVARHFPGVGVVAEWVAPGSPAAVAGFRPGDVVVSVNGKGIGDTEGLRAGIAGAPADIPLAIGVRRNGIPLEIELHPFPINGFAAASNR